MKHNTQQAYEERILRVLVYIQENLDGTLSLQSISAVAEFSPYHFHRIFKSVVGETVKEYVRRLRLERAARSLKNTKDSITDLAFRAGYETHESFSRAFRLLFHDTPSGYRKKNQQSEYPFFPSRQVYLQKLKDISEGIQPNVPVEIHVIEKLPIAFIRRLGAYSLERIQKANDRLVRHFRAKGMKVEQMQLIGIPYDDPDITPEDKLRYDACIVVGEDFQPSGDIGLQHIHGGDYAIISHRESIDTLETTILRFYGDWLPFSKRELRPEPFFLRYIFDTEQNIQSIDIYMPLKEKISS